MLQKGKGCLGYLRFCQVFRFFLSSGEHGGLFHWLDRIVVGLFVFVAQKASQIGPSKWYQIVYDHLCIGIESKIFHVQQIQAKIENSKLKPYYFKKQCSLSSFLLT